MTITEARTSKKLYANIFLSLVICIIVTIVVLSSALYSNFEKIALSNIYASEKSSLSQSSYSAKSMIESSTNYALQIYADPQFDKLLYYTAPSSIDINSALNRLNTYLTVNNFFHSIYIYSKNSKKVYASSLSTINAIQSLDSFSDTEAHHLIDNFDSYKRLAPIPRVVPVQTPFQDIVKTANVYTFVFYDRGNSKDLDNLIMLNISERWMKEAIASLDIDKNGSTFIIDHKGSLVSSTDTMPFLTNLNDKPYVQHVLSNAQAQSSGYFVDQVDGVKSLVVYSKHEFSNWIFMRVLPYETIMGKFEAMKQNVLIICSILLLIGLTISFLISKSLYRPIDKVISKINRLTDEKRNNHFKLKQDFLRRLILNSGNKKLSDYEAKLEEYEISIDPYSDYIVVILNIDHFDTFSNQYNYEDRVLLKYAIMNIASEVFAQVGSCECIDMDEKNVVVLLNGDIQNDVDLTQVSRQVQDSISKYLNLSMSISISRVGDNLTEISDLFSEAAQMLEHKFITGHRSILQGIHQSPIVHTPFMHPTILENNMLETFKLGKPEETKKWFDDIVNTIEHKSYIVYNMLFNQLAYSISTTMLNLEKNSGVSLNYDFSSFVQNMQKMETLQDIHDHFYELIDQLCAGLKDRKSSKHDNLFATVDQLIQMHYADRELSPYKIAELIDMAPGYMGRIFKKQVSKSIPDYLNEYRIERAKELLITTNDSIEEISQKTGYNNSSYFYKVFKKYMGITPAEYRNHGN
jgi:two-component system response regulator YesN